MTDSEFEQDVSRAMRAADTGPVVITEDGEPAYVLLRHDAYRRLVGKGSSIRDALAMPGTDDFDFDPPRMRDGSFKIPDFD